MKKGFIIGGACVCLLAGLCASTYAIYQTSYNTGGQVATRHYDLTTLAITTISDGLNSDEIAANESLSYGFFVSSKGELENDYRLQIVTTNKNENILQTISVGSTSYAYSNNNTTTNCIIDDKFVDVEDDKDILVRILFTNNSSTVIDVSDLVVSVSASVVDPDKPESSKYDFYYDMDQGFGLNRISFEENEDDDVLTTSGTLDLKKNKNDKFSLSFYDGNDEEYHYLKKITKTNTSSGHDTEFVGKDDISDDNTKNVTLEVVIPSYYEKENRSLYINFVEDSDFDINTFYNQYLADAQDLFGNVYILNKTNSSNCIVTRSDMVLNGDLTIVSAKDVSINQNGGKTFKAHGKGSVIFKGNNVTFADNSTTINGDISLVFDLTGAVTANYNLTIPADFKVLNSSSISVLGLTSNNGDIYFSSNGTITTNSYPLMTGGSFEVANASNVILGELTARQGAKFNVSGNINILNYKAMVDNGDFVVANSANISLRGLVVNNGNVTLNSTGDIVIGDLGLVANNNDLIVHHSKTFTANGAIYVGNMNILSNESIIFYRQVNANKAVFTFTNRAYLYLTSNANIQEVTINLAVVNNSRLLLSNKSNSISINVLSEQALMRIAYYDSSKITANGVSFNNSSDNVLSIEYNPTAPITMNAVGSF